MNLRIGEVARKLKFQLPFLNFHVKCWQSTQEWNNFLILPEMDSFNNQMEVYTWVFHIGPDIRPQKCSRFSIQPAFVSTGCWLTGERDDIFFIIIICETVMMPTSIFVSWLAMIAPDLLTRCSTRPCVTWIPGFSHWTANFCSSTYEPPGFI